MKGHFIVVWEQHIWLKLSRFHEFGIPMKPLIFFKKTCFQNWNFQTQGVANVISFMLSNGYDLLTLHVPFYFHSAQFLQLL
jgi:hypothetical protein